MRCICITFGLGFSLLRFIKGLAVSPPSPSSPQCSVWLQQEPSGSRDNRSKSDRSRAKDSSTLCGRNIDLVPVGPFLSLSKPSCVFESVPQCLHHHYHPTTTTTTAPTPILAFCTFTWPHVRPVKDFFNLFCAQGRHERNAASLLFMRTSYEF